MGDTHRVILTQMLTYSKLQFGKIQSLPCNGFLSKILAAGKLTSHSEVLLDKCLKTLYNEDNKGVPLTISGSPPERYKK